MAESAAVRVPSRSWLLLFWMASSLVLIGLWGVFQVTRVAGDDPDPGRQRPGILDLGNLPTPAPPIEGVPLLRGSRAVVFFAASEDSRKLCTRLGNKDDLDGEIVVVIGNPRGSCPAASHLIRIEPAPAARAFGMPEPRGNVPPSGYAIVDSSGRIRYRTLDPVSAELLDEVATMLRAVR